jgi:heavy metal sensor kinase
MSSKRKIEMGRSLAFRLTLMYAVISTVSLFAVLAVSYLMLRGILQRQLDQGLVNEIAEYGALLEKQNIDVMRDVLGQEVASEGTDRIFFRILDGAGREILATDMRAWPGVETKMPHLLAAADGRTVFETWRSGSRPHPARIVYGRLGNGLVMQLGESTAANAEVLAYYRRIFTVASAAFVACSILIGSLMARRALSGVQRVTQAARDISAGAWDSRVPLSHREDEIDELASAFNDMVERIQMLIKGLREVTDDIAHDLRTPLTRMRAAAELALRGPAEHAGRHEMTETILEECDQLLVIINTMLDISQTEAGARPLARERLDLSALAEDVYELFRPAAEDKAVALALERCPDLVVDGDPQRLKRAIAHIVDNAVKYTGSDGSVTVACTREGRMAVVSVRDTGEGIPAADVAKVFDRFYRADQSRSQRGNGLGLSLSRAICRAHGGDLTVASVLGEGSTFAVVLPLVTD